MTADWERVLRVNVTGPFLAARRVAPEMMRQGGGAIVNVASTSSGKATRVTPIPAYDVSRPRSRISRARSRSSGRRRACA
jgi:NAD(P)-dependent dehydrogenase (short-subunit alcohol dehydrogenase family)